MKSVDDPEFLLLKKAKELKKRVGESPELDEMIAMAEGIIQQNFYGAFAYMMAASELTDMKKQLDVLITMLTEAKSTDKQD